MRIDTPPTVVALYRLSRLIYTLRARIIFLVPSYFRARSSLSTLCLVNNYFARKSAGIRKSRFFCFPLAPFRVLPPPSPLPGDSPAEARKRDENSNAVLKLQRCNCWGYYVTTFSAFSLTCHIGFSIDHCRNMIFESRISRCLRNPYSKSNRPKYLDEKPRVANFVRTKRKIYISISIL